MNAAAPAIQKLGGGRWIWLSFCVLLLLLGALAHLAYLVWDCPLDLSGDEAHYWDWSRRLDLSYYSKGPLVAYIIALGRALLGTWSRGLVGSEMLAVRTPAIVLSIVTGLGLYVLAMQTLRRPPLACAAVALTFTMPIFAVGAVLMTIDAPLACAYVWTLVLCTHGLQGARLWPWLLAGVCIALGILAKYTMLLVFPPVGLALLSQAAYRPQLRRPGPYLAMLIGSLGFVPILVWNAQHDWVSFRHVAGQAGMAGRPVFDPGGVGNLLGGQLGVVGPLWFCALVWAVISLWRRPTPQAREAHDTDALRLLLYATVTPWLVFLGFSVITKVQPNWPLPALLPGTVVLVAWLARRRHVAPRATRAFVLLSVVLGGLSVVVLHRTEWIIPLLGRVAGPPSALNLTPVAKLDPTARLRGWSALGAAVGRHLTAEQAAGNKPFIVTDDYQVASQVAFYCPGQPRTYCLQAVLGDRPSQYDIWRPNPVADPAVFGGPCIYVGSERPELFRALDDDTPPVLRGVRSAETVRHEVRGHVMQVWRIFVCEEFTGLPPALAARAGGRY